MEAKDALGAMVARMAHSPAHMGEVPHPQKGEVPHPQKAEVRTHMEAALLRARLAGLAEPAETAGASSSPRGDS